MGRDRVWVEWEFGIIDGIYAGLERQNRSARHDVSLLQAILTLCDRLAGARDALLQDAVDAGAAQPWRVSQGGGDQTPVVAASGTREVRQ